MDYLEIARTRQSCRSYDAARPVEEEKLLACLEAARLAPSACNAQPYHITVAGFTREVPVFLVISEAAYNRTASVGSKVKQQDYRSVDIGIAAAYLTAEAQSQGLSTCILGWFDSKKLRQLLDLKGEPRLVIALGYARTGDPLRSKKRKSLDNLVTWK